MLSTAQIRVVSLLLSYYVEVENYELLLKELKKAREKPTGLGEGESGFTGTTKAWPVCFLLFSWKYLARYKEIHFGNFKTRRVNFVGSKMG